MELLTNFFDQGSCINSFTETGKRPQPTRLQGTVSFHSLGGVNLDIPLVLSKLNVIETMNTDLPKH